MIEIKVLNPVALQPARTNTYELVVTVMHGDADKYEDMIARGNHDKIMKYLVVLDAFFKLSWNAGCDIDSVKAAVKATTLEDGDHAWDRYSDFVGRDVTCEDYLASPDQIKLFWYDAFGVKHHTEISGMKTTRH